MNTELKAVFDRFNECVPATLKIDVVSDDMLSITGEHGHLHEFKLKFVVTQFNPSLLAKTDGREYPVQYGITFYVNEAKAVHTDTETDKTLTFADIRDVIRLIQIRIRSAERFNRTDAYNFLHQLV